MAFTAKPRDVQVQVIDSPSALEAISRADFDTQITTAKRFPMHSNAQQLQAFQEKSIMMATMNRETAESCLYAVPRAGSMIEGRSVRLAEIVVSAYGNIKALARIIDTTDKEVVAQGVCHDLENNVSTSVEVRRRIVNKQGQRYGDDMIQTTANAACAIAFRNAVYKVVPAALCDPAYNAAKKMAVGDMQSIEIRRPKAFNRFALMGISQDRVLATLGRTTTVDVTGDDLATLVGIYNAIKNGEATIEESFPNIEEPLSASPGVRSAILADKIKQKAQEAEPEPDPDSDLPDAEPVYAEPPDEDPPADDGDSDREWILNELGDEPWPARYKALKADDALPKGFPYRKAIDGYDGNEQDTIRTAMGG